MSDGERWALVTGASEGIGRALALELAARGWHIAATARSADRLDELAEVVAGEGVEADTLPLDLAEPDSAADLWDWAADGRFISFLANNAGLAAYGPVPDTGWERERDSIRVNVEAATALAKAAAREMRAAGTGRILNIASTAAFQPAPGMAVYAASKAYLLSFSEALAIELRGTGVTVTALCPGATTTRFQARSGMERARLMRFGAAAPEDVAAYGVAAALRGQRVAVPGRFNRLAALGAGLVPHGVSGRVAAWLLSPADRA